MKAVWTVFIAVAISTCCSDFLAGQSDVFPSLFPVRCYFTGQTEVPIGDTDLTTADVDGDGSVDILNIDSETDLLTVWFNNGNGLFAPNLSIPVPDETLLAGVGNFNDDGIVDFLLLPDFRNWSRRHFLDCCELKQLDLPDVGSDPDTTDIFNRCRCC